MTSEHDHIHEAYIKAPISTEALKGKLLIFQPKHVKKNHGELPAARVFRVSETVSKSGEIVGADN